MPFCIPECGESCDSDTKPTNCEPASRDLSTGRQPKQAGLLRHVKDDHVKQKLVEFNRKSLPEEYKNIGRWKGTRASAETQSRGQDFWHDAGKDGAEWLVRRLRTETHPDVLDGAASILASMGTISVEPILVALQQRPTRDQALALLMALRWIRYGRTTDVPRKALEILQQYLRHTDPDLREAAANATALLPAEQAIRLLGQALAYEIDEEVRSVLRDLLPDREAHCA